MERRLVAYVVEHSPNQAPPNNAALETPTSNLNVSELRRALREKLPEYMIPTSLVLLDALPLTPNGKVDRKALPAPDSSRPQLETAFVAPRTPTEVELAELWMELLHIEKVGIQDNFFDIGGHSLLAMQLIAQIQARFGVEVSLRNYFMRPTIKDLAEMIEEALLDSSDLAKFEEMLDLLEGLSEDDAQHLLTRQDSEP
jgi:acyl carrier protein